MSINRFEVIELFACRGTPAKFAIKDRDTGRVVEDDLDDLSEAIDRADWLSARDRGIA